MKRWVIYIVLAVVIIGAIGFLYWKGKLQDLSWETVAIIVAAAIGPLKMLIGWVNKGEEKSIAKKDAENTESHEEKELKRRTLASDIKEQEERTFKLEKDIELLSANIEILELKKKQLNGEI